MFERSVNTCKSKRTNHHQKKGNLQLCIDRYCTMGNKTFKEFQQKPICAGPMKGDESYLLSKVTDMELSLLQKVKGLTGGKSEYISADSEEVIFKEKHTLSGKKSVVYDKDDIILCAAVFKTGFKSNKMW